MQKLLNLLDRLRSSLWFTPAVMTAGAVAAAWTVQWLDRWVDDTKAAPLVWAFSGGADSARQLLATIAGSMITVAGVTFSITIVALALASNQFAPRVLRNFMRDRISQTILGAFVGTFVYTLLVLRSIRGGDDAYVPEVGVTLAILAAVLSLGLFIFFIHHIATSIQVSTIIHNVARETHEVIERLLGDDPTVAGAPRPAAAPRPAGIPILSCDDGYVIRLDLGALVEAAADADVVLHVVVGPGEYAIRGTPLAVADGASGEDEGLAEDVREAFFLARQRTMAQDTAFGFRQLVDIAVKAISPGINDPTTACNCIDALTGFLVRLADQDLPRGVLDDADGRERVHVPTVEFPAYLSLAFSEIRRYGAGDVSVVLRLLDGLTRVAGTTRRSDRREAVWREALAVAAAARREIELPMDREPVDERLERLASILGHDSDPRPGDAERDASAEGRRPG